MKTHLLAAALVFGSALAAAPAARAGSWSLFWQMMEGHRADHAEDEAKQLRRRVTALEAQTQRLERENARLLRELKQARFEKALGQPRGTNVR